MKRTMTKKILDLDFFMRDAFEIAPVLLGKFLVRKDGREKIAEMITEVEVYDGLEDLASHASRGKTERNKVMFEEGGVWYVYLVYGIHNLLNIVVGPKDQPAAILIRQTEKAKGPGLVSRHFKVDKLFYGRPANEKSDLWIEDRGVEIKPEQIKKAPRIGVAYAGPVWSKKEWRYYLKN